MFSAISPKKQRTGAAECLLLEGRAGPCFDGQALFSIRLGGGRLVRASMLQTC